MGLNLMPLVNGKIASFFCTEIKNFSGLPGIG